MKATVVGAEGFIGRHLVREFRRQGWVCRPVDRISREDLSGENLGHIVYCAGVTSDFLARPADTITAHVGGIRDIVECGQYQSILYLSSTRVYFKNDSAVESSHIVVDSRQRDQLYNLTKLLGENICRFSVQPAKVVRLSNVYGGDWEGPTFLSEIIRMAVNGKITLRSSLSSEKDYVALSDVIAVLPRIILDGKEDIYNVASGSNVSHAALLEELQRITGCELSAPADTEGVVFPVIDVGQLREEFGWNPRLLLPDLPDMIRDYKEWRLRNATRCV